MTRIIGMEIRYDAYEKHEEKIQMLKDLYKLYKSNHIEKMYHNAKSGLPQLTMDLYDLNTEFDDDFNDESIKRIVLGGQGITPEFGQLIEKLWKNYDDDGMFKVSEWVVNDVINLKDKYGDQIDIFNMYGLLYVGNLVDNKLILNDKCIEHSQSKIKIDILDFDDCETDEDIEEKFHELFKEEIMNNWLDDNL